MSCPCGASDDQLVQYFAEGEIDFRFCKNCGCVFREHFPSTEALEEIYLQAYAEGKISAASTNQESGEYAVCSYANYLLQHIVNPGDRLLDYGAGSGMLLAELRDRGLDADGVEYAESARTYCLKHRGFSLMADLNGVSDDHYQVVSMIEVIEHLTDLTGSLKEIFRVLVPGGWLLVATPSRSGLRALIEKGYWREAQKKFHLFLFDWRSINYHLK
ncbi:class I SAM-dependent methyltransferase, partial [bacterium]|nr:class I SAM-dependent methyltransferase [bacterium]